MSEPELDPVAQELRRRYDAKQAEYQNRIEADKVDAAGGDGLKALLEKMRERAATLNRVCRVCKAETDPKNLGLCPACRAKQTAAEEEAKAKARAADTHDLMRPLKEIHNPAVAGLRHRLYDSGFVVDEWNSIAAKWARNYRADCGAWVYGTPGSGKSYMVAAVCKHYAEQGYAAVMAKAGELLVHVTGLKFSDNSAHKAAMASLLRAKILFLDDLGATRYTEGNLDVLREIVEGRLENSRPVIITSNASRKEVLEQPDKDRPGSGDLVRKWTNTIGRTNTESLLSRLVAVTGREVWCSFPGDRRTGFYDKGMEQPLRSVRAQWLKENQQ